MKSKKKHTHRTEKRREMLKSLNILTLLFLTLICGCYAPIYTAQNVPAGQLPPPLQHKSTTSNFIVIGMGGSGGLFATLAAQAGLPVLLLDDGYEIDFTEMGIVPGTEFLGYYHPGLERSWLIEPNSAVDGHFQLSYGALVRDIQGGDMRLSHYAIEMGSSEVHRKSFYELYGCPPEWSPEYIWGPVNDLLLNFSGPNITANHANIGINGKAIRAQESRASAWTDAWLESCVSQIPGTRIENDFNTVNGSIMTCGAEPSNVRTDGLRSITENEYVIPIAEAPGSKLTLIRDTKITKILIDKKPCNSRQNQCKPYAIGVEGFFRNEYFQITFSHKQPSDPPQLNKYHKVVLATGTIPTAQLLKLSGVGPADELNKFHIPVIANISSVGKHLKEGSVTYQQFNSMNATVQDIMGYSYPNVTDWVTSRPGAFVEWTPEGWDHPLKMFLLWTPANFGSDTNPFIVGYTLPFEMEQELEGSVTLISPNIADYPKVDYGWTYEHTIAKHVETFRLFRKILHNGTIASRFQLYEVYPTAGIDDSDYEGLATAAARGIQAILHASGTARFAINNDPEDGVVDMDNNVLGVQDLKVISMAVFPYFAAGGGQTWSHIIAFNAINKVLTELNKPIYGPDPQSYAGACPPQEELKRAPIPSGGTPLNVKIK